MPTMMFPELADSRDYVNTSGLSRQEIFQQVEASLKRLETDYIDLPQIHRADSNVPIEETMRALNDLVRSGKVRYIGASSMWTWQFAEYQHISEKNGWTKFISMQNQYSLLYREEEREMNKYCDFTSVGLIPWSPLAAGQLARPLSQSTAREDSAKGTPFEMKKSEADKEIINRVEKLAKEKGWTMDQVAHAWINTKVALPIIGFSSVARLEEAIIPNKNRRSSIWRSLTCPSPLMAISDHGTFNGRLLILCCVCGSK
ncbi:Aldo/keto reductase [Calocera cornea HHB12733]|uniref:Aldo/keto reductase n=1 Tax=Calocera cornea HHB12733 TaxID=1353952 RepID=A0A165I8A3_9BASI|nr:Aldo/keto reductase [Calocera cornea HHB12733]